MKIPTLWNQNSAKNADAVQYSSASVQYSASTVYYSSSTVGANENGKPDTLWARPAGVTTAWQNNAAYYLNQYTYDSAVFTYDSAVQTYDGVNGSQQVIGTKPTTAWANV